MDRFAELEQFADSGAVGATKDSYVEGRVAAARSLLADLPAGHPDVAFRSMLLAVALQARAGATGNRADLAEGTSLIRRAIELTGPDDDWLPEYLMSLVSYLHQAYTLDQDPDDLAAAIDAVERALALTPAGHPHEAKRLGIAAALYRTRAVTVRRRSDLAAAERLNRRAVEVSHPADLMRPGYVADLALTLAVVAEWDGRVDRAVEARTLFRQAVRQAHPYDPRVPLFVAGLRNTRLLVRRFG